MTEHHEILEAVLVGDLARDDARVRAHLAECASCREELAELEALSSSVETTGAAERADLAEALSSSTPPSADFQALLDAHRVQEPAARGLGSWRRLAAAAALLLLASVAAWLALGRSEEPEPDERNPLLGGEDSEIVLLESPAPGVLAWSFDLPEDGHYIVSLIDVSRTDPAPLLQRVEVTESPWKPRDPILGTAIELPEAFVLQIEAYDGRGERVASLEARWPR